LAFFSLTLTGLPLPAACALAERQHPLETFAPCLPLLTQDLTELLEFPEELLLLFVGELLLPHPIDVLGALLEVLGALTEILHEVLCGLREVFVETRELLLCRVVLRPLSVE